MKDLTFDNDELEEFLSFMGKAESGYDYSRRMHGTAFELWSKLVAKKRADQIVYRKIMFEEKIDLIV